MIEVFFRFLTESTLLHRDSSITSDNVFDERLEDAPLDKSSITGSVQRVWNSMSALRRESLTSLISQEASNVKGSIKQGKMIHSESFRILWTGLMNFL